MKKLYVQSTKDSPEVKFEPQSGNFSIVGISHPENISTFFDPVIKWLDDYLNELKVSGIGSVQPIKLRLFFKYINSASYKYLITFLQKMNEFVDIGIQVNLEWQYECEDEDMREAGYELMEYSGIKIPFTCNVCTDPI
ncbi:MAG: DUF1987 domain-containing protein [Bacteroidales bacterium]